jgi:hypothetical protein
VVAVSAYLIYTASHRMGYAAPPRLRIQFGRPGTMIVSSVVLVSWTALRNVPQFSWFNSGWQQ